MYSARAIRAAATRSLEDNTFVVRG